MVIQGTSGRALAFFVDDWHVEDINPDAFDPITTLHDDDHVHPTEMAEQHAEGLYAKNGFLVRPNADGAVYGISWRRYQTAIKGLSTIAQKRTALAALEAKKFEGKEATWIECPMVKVFGTDGDGTGHYETVATEVEIGIIL